MAGKGKKLTEEQVTNQQEVYSEGVAASLLDPVFSKWDDITDSLEATSSLPFIDRADHIIINGRTATEYLMDKFNEELPNMRGGDGKPYKDYERQQAYHDFYLKNAKKMINQMVASALATGGNVEVFVPNKTTGEIENEPMRLTRTGYKAADPIAKPAQLSRWKQFWGKLGFYKLERAQYQQQLQSYEARENVRKKAKFCHKTGQAQLHTNNTLKEAYTEELFNHYPKVKEEVNSKYPEIHGNLSLLGYANGFRTARGSFACSAISVLASKRDPHDPKKFLYTNEELFDLSSTKMQKARADAMKEVYDHYMKAKKLKEEQTEQENLAKKGEKYEIDTKVVEDAKEALDWLIDVQVEASKTVTERVNIQARKLDFSRPDLTEQKGYREFALLGDTAFDISQDVVSTREEMDLRHGKGTYDDVSGRVGAWSQVFRRHGRSLLSQKSLVNGVVGKSEAKICGKLQDVFEAQARQQGIAQLLHDNKGMDFSDVATNDLNLAAGGVVNEYAYDDDVVRMYRENPKKVKITNGMKQSLKLSDEYRTNPEKFTGEIVSGVFENRLKIKKFTLDIEDDNPIKFDVTDSATAKRKMERQQTQTRTGGGLQVTG